MNRYIKPFLLIFITIAISCGNNEPTVSYENIDLGPAFFDSEVSITVDKINPTDHVGGDRAANQLIVYTNRYGSQTETNAYGIEAIVENSIVVKVGGNNSAIPSVGMVVSGHGTAATWINENIKVGCSITLKGLTLQVTSSENSIIEQARLYIKNGESRLESIRHSSIDETNAKEKKDAFYEELLLFVKAKTDGDSANVESIANQVLLLAKNYYYYTFPSITGKERAAWLEIQGMSEEDIEAVFIDLADLGFNTVCPEVIYRGWAIFPDAPNGLGQYPDFIGRDPMQEMIELGKKYNIAIVPWVWVFFIGTEKYPDLINSRHDWLAISRNGQYPTQSEPKFYYFCPSRIEVHEFWLDVYEYMINKYKLENLQLDYIRYPGESWSTDYCYCDVCREKFAAQNNGADPININPNDNPELWEKWDSFRENNVSTFVEEVRNKFPELNISADVVPDQEYSLEYKKQNWSKWLENEWLNTAYIMSYTSDVDLLESHIDYMSGRIKESQRGVAGLGPYAGMSADILIDEIELARIKGIDGTCLFIYNALTEEQKYALMKGPYRETE